MTYQPINDSNKAQFIGWLENILSDLGSMPEDSAIRKVFPGSTDGDVATAKDLAGNFLATLKNETINC